MQKIHNQVLNTMLNICNMDYANHEKVALAGIVPSLMWFIEEGSVHFLKELSLKLFLAMPHSSGTKRLSATFRRRPYVSTHRARRNFF